jgi:tripartite-type tricarboxylate transporter receptor subunit TctC
MYRFTRRQVVVATALAPFAPRVARAATYPERPIRIIVPQAAGGVAETILRLLSVNMEQRLGTKIFIESRPGAAGNLGTIEVARAEPDGYTVLVAAANNFVINQFLFKMPIDPLVALMPVAKIADVPLVLFSNNSNEARTLDDFIKLAKANPGKFNYGTPNAGTINHLFMEKLKQTAGIDVVHVPYKGSPPAMLGLLSNEIQIFPIGLGVGEPYMREGKVKALAVATEHRMSQLPEVATVIESGFPGMTASNWWGMAVPRGTSVPVVQTLFDAVTEAMKDPTVAQRFEQLGFLLPTESTQYFAAEISTEAGTWSETIKRGNISIDQ